ncbi:MAG: adenine phosphoribosyltransferase [Ruminococcaceae bacterium]|nr:adenine phosphoribosyltransferase [Oscillospiraceae bacterium]
MGMTYEMNIAGLRRDLPLCRVTDDLYIGAFVIFGDVEITVASAEALLKKAPEFDVIVTAEAKSIPLAYEMARQSGKYHYIVARKYPKLYMKNVVSVKVRSITTDKEQTLYLAEDEVEYIQGKRVLIVDDVISTGESLRAVEALVEKAQGNVVGRMSVLAEGDAANRDDILFLEKLPLFNADGSVKE